MGLLNGEPVDPNDPYIKGREWEEYGFRFFPTLVETLSDLPFATMEPHDNLIESLDGAHCLADPARALLVYFSTGGQAQVTLGRGEWQAHWVNPRTGEKTAPAPIEDRQTTFTCPDEEDWALVLTRD